MPPKGKQMTKGKKQIAEENKSTLNFYTTVILAANGIYLTLQYLFFWDSFSFLCWTMLLITSGVNFGSFKCMSSMARATYDPATGNLIDSGIDLNMESGMAEHMKDLILLTAVVQVLSLISNYFWLLYLAAPGRAFYLLWVNILSPWFFAEAPEQDEKKMKKLDRKMKRR